MRKHKDTLANILLTITVFLAVVWVYNYKHDLPSEQPTEEKVTEEKPYPQSEEEYLSNFGGPPEEVIKELYGTKDGCLYPLQCNQSGLRIGNEYEAIFKIRFYPDEGENPEELYIYQNDVLLGTMHDDGKNGDDIKGDCIYTYATEMVANSLDDQFDFYASCGTRKSDILSLYSIRELTDKDWNDMDALNEELKKVELSYTDETGYVPYSLMEEAVNALYECAVTYCSKNGIEINAIEKSHDGIYIDYKFGISSIYDIKQYGVESAGNGSVSITLVEPYYDGGLVSFEDQASYMDIALGKQAEFTTQLNSNEVTHENIPSVFTPNSILIWHGHGGYKEDVGPYLLTGMPANEENVSKYQDDFASQAMIHYSDNIGITSVYIDKYIEDLSGTFVYLGACHSEEDARLANAMVAKGAVVVQGFSDTVYTSYDSAILDSMSHELCKFDSETECYQDFNTSFKNTVQNYENNDIDYVKKYTNKKEFKDTTAYLLYYGDHSYCISDYIQEDANNEQNNNVVDSVKDIFSQKCDQFLSSIWDRISEFLQKIVYELKVFWYGKKAMGVS